MVIYTGDTHGYTEKIVTITDKLSLTESDTIVILGDAGYNYFGNEYGDLRNKRIIGRMSPTVFCIHGNHEMRPSTIPSYTTKEWNGGMVYYEQAFPNLLFAIDGEIYDLDGKRTIVIGGLIQSKSIIAYIAVSIGFPMNSHRMRSRRRSKPFWIKKAGKSIKFSHIPVPISTDRLKPFSRVWISQLSTLQPKSG